MSTVVYFKTIRIEIRSKEANHKGRPHCHAVKDGCDASIDIVSLEVLESTGFALSDIKSILVQVKKYQEELLDKWEEFHG